MEIINMQSGDIENKLKFPGQYSETNMSLYYNWHRYYFYKIGRYNKIKTNEIKSIISEDIYPYVWANPIIHMDLNGLYGKRARNCINSIGKGGSDEEPYAITVCDGCDGFEWRWLKKPPCAEECYEGHEKAHIEWFEKNKPDACKGRPKGSNPLLGPGDKEKTECYSYKYSSDCMERWRLKSNMPGYTSECKSFVKHNYNLQIKNRDKYCKKGG
ncbi:MAG: RHS repeat-associated core domain-containing protein [Candidatus Aenigmatarchaeota archaeon]